MADREGFLVIDEVAAVGFFESLMNFMEASTGTKKSFFDHETIPELKDNHKNALTDLIKRDKNYACVIAWSIFNEPDSTSEKAVPYFKELFELAHELDVQKRPRTYANIMMATPDKDLCYQFCDIMAFNRYYGWYYKGGYEICNAEKSFRQEMDEWKKIAGSKPWIFTEYGADTYAGEHKLPSVMWSEEYQKEYLDMTHEIFDSYENIKGEQVWNFADFQTTEGIMRVNGNKKGIFTRQRQPKEAAYLFKKRWESLPLDYKSLKNS
jgi:beta-glucuronidase